MALNTELMAKGMPASQAHSIGQDPLTAALTATGSVQGDAFVLVGSSALFGTVGAGTGALLPSAVGKADYVILNSGSNALTVYPTGSEKINNTTSFSVTNGKSAVFKALGNGWIANLSA